MIRRKLWRRKKGTAVVVMKINVQRNNDENCYSHGAVRTDGGDSLSQMW